MWRVQYDHSGVRSYGRFQLFHVYCPFGRGGCFHGTSWWWMHGNVDNFASRHLDVADVPMNESVRRQIERSMAVHVLIEEGFKNNYFVALFQEPHERAKHAFICARCYGDLFVRIQLSTPKRRIRIGNSFPQPRSAFCRRVLITIDSIQDLFRRV